MQIDYSWVTFIYRALARDSKKDRFDKELVEDNILCWMPFEVGKEHILYQTYRSK